MSKNPIEMIDKAVTEEWPEIWWGDELAELVVANLEAAGLRIIDPERPTEGMERALCAVYDDTAGDEDYHARDVAALKAANSAAPTWSDES